MEIVTIMRFAKYLWVVYTMTHEMVSDRNHDSSSISYNHHVLFCTAEFRNYFEKYGRVLSAEVMFNRETHKSRGFGFIVFESEVGVDAVCAEREHIIDGKLVSQQT